MLHDLAHRRRLGRHARRVELHQLVHVHVGALVVAAVSRGGVRVHREVDAVLGVHLPWMWLLLPSSEMAHELSFMWYAASAELGRPIIDIGGECSAMEGSVGPLKDRGETEGGPRFEGLTMGERKVLL